MTASKFDRIVATGDKELLSHALCDVYELTFLNDGVDKVPPAYRTVMAVEKFYGETWNGGFVQYLTNGNGAFAIYAVPALQEMGLQAPADSLEAALSLFPKEALNDREPDFLDCLDAVEEKFGESHLEDVVEKKFWDWYNDQENEDVIRDSLHQWIMAHREQLTTTAEQDGDAKRD